MGVNGVFSIFSIETGLHCKKGLTNEKAGITCGGARYTLSGRLTMLGYSAMLKFISWS